MLINLLKFFKYQKRNLEAIPNDLNITIEESVIFSYVLTKFD